MLSCGKDTNLKMMSDNPSILVYLIDKPFNKSMFFSVFDLCGIK